MKTLFLLGILVLSVAAKDVIVDLRDESNEAPDTVSINMDDNLMLYLTENPTTGFRWIQIKSDINSAQAIDLVS